MAPNIPKPDIGSGRKKDQNNKNVLKRDPDEVRGIFGRAAERDPVVTEDKSTTRAVKPRIRGMKQDPDTMRSSLNDLRSYEVLGPAFRRATATPRTAASSLDFNLVNAKSKSSTKVKRKPKEVTSAVRGFLTRHKTRSSATFPSVASHQRNTMPDHVASRSKNSMKMKGELEEVTSAVRGISSRHKTRSSDTFPFSASHQRSAMPNHVASRSGNSTKVKSEPKEVTSAVRGISSRHKTRSLDTFPFAASHQRSAMPDHVASRSKNSTKMKGELEEVTSAVRGISSRHKTRSSETFPFAASHQRTRTYQSVKKEPDNRKPVARKRSFEGVDSSVARENRNCSPTAHVPRLDVQEPRRSPSVKESSNKKQKTSNSRNNIGYGRCQPDSGGGTALVRHSMNMDNGLLFLAVATAAVCLMSAMLLQSTAASSEDEDSSDDDY